MSNRNSNLKGWIALNALILKKKWISKENIWDLEQEMFLIVYNSVAEPDKNLAI